MAAAEGRPGYQHRAVLDLVYVFAIIQLSHHLLDHPTLVGAMQSALLWSMVWLVDLYTTGVVPGLNDARFQGFAEEAKEGCPISGALAAVSEITVTAKLA